ncbi:MAG: hypothetical protein WDZ35_15660 [Crocinitomicaceae bacterium]
MLRTAKVLFLFLPIAFSSLAQKGTHTPYSAFGLGELKMNDYASFQSMGGVGLAGNDSSIINHINPASYVNFGRNRPILQIGLNGRLSRFETSTQSTDQRHFGFNQLQLGIPIKKRWGAAVGIKPYSFTGYQISNYIIEDGDSTQLYTNEGSGGITNAYIGLAYRPVQHAFTKKRYTHYKDSTGLKYRDSVNIQYENHLSLGGNANYLFGSSNRIRTYQYWSSSQGLNSKVRNSLRFSDFIFDIGLSYQFSWKVNKPGSEKSKNTISIGATYSPAISVRAFQDVYSYSYITLGGGFNGPELVSDTIEYVSDNKGSVRIPESYKIGLEYRLGPKGVSNSSIFRIATDFHYQKWSDYNEDFGGTFTHQLKDRMRMAVGLEWTPSSIHGTRTPFMSKIRYRLGFNYTMIEKRILNNIDNYTDLTSYGMSFGVGIPITIIQLSNTNINFGANLGKLGTTENGLIQEKYVGLFVGISITPGSGNLWFLKRKYD